MKIAYFDCLSGISGDMILGALIDLGLGLKELKDEINKLDISKYEIRIKRAKRKGITGVGVEIIAKEKGGKRKLEDILTIINQSRLADEVKNSARKIFSRLADVEAKIHQKDKRKASFHELGRADTIIDIVGTLIGMKKLGIKKIYSSPLHIGSGFVKCAHGLLGVPAPATLELLKGIPIYGRDIEAELVTPTGAALISSLSRGFGKMPLMKIERIGYGLGKRDLSIPNLLRILVGEGRPDYEEDVISLIETNIDDMNPQIFDHLMRRLFQKGALDVWFTPIQMKKNRPAITLSVLADKGNVEDICEVIFNESTTLGLRISELKRKKLQREVRVVETKYGKIRVKLAKFKGDIKNISPSYQECQRLANKLGIPFKEIYDGAKRQALRLLKTV